MGRLPIPGPFARRSHAARAPLGRHSRAARHSAPLGPRRNEPDRDDVLKARWPPAHMRSARTSAPEDLQRDRINVDGADFACPVGDDLAAHVCHRVLEGAGFPQEENAEVKAAVMARDVLLGCSRTQGGGDTFDAVQAPFPLIWGRCRGRHGFHQHAPAAPAEG